MGSVFTKGSQQSGQSSGISEGQSRIAQHLVDQTDPLRKKAVTYLESAMGGGELPPGMDFKQTYTQLNRPTLGYQSVPYSTVPYSAVPFQRVAPEALTGTIQDAASEQGAMQRAALDAGVRGGALGNTLFQADLKRRMMVDAFRAQEAQKEQLFNLGQAVKGQDFNLGEATGARNYNVAEAGRGRDFNLREQGASRDYGVTEAGAARDFALQRQLDEQGLRQNLFGQALGTGFGQAQVGLQGMGNAANNLTSLGAQRIQQNMALQQGLGQAAGMAGKALFACWVARRLYGDTFRMALVRHWFLYRAPRWMASLYARRGEWASRQWWCPVLRPVFDFCVGRAMRGAYGTA